jgi:hypothetical protein
MPRAARADSEYLAGTSCGGSRISVSDGSDDEHASASLRHSEETAVENPPCHAVPDVGQRSNNDSEVPAAVRGEQSGYVLDEKPSRLKRLSDAGELVEEDGSLASEASSLSSHGYVLAREAAAEKINRPFVQLSRGLMSVTASSKFRRSKPNVSNVLVDGHSGPMVGEHPSSPRIRLTEEGVSKPSTGEAKVEPADAGEE